MKHSQSSKTTANVANGTVFGYDVEYVNGKYEFVGDTYVKDANMSSNQDAILQNHHYTCFKSASEDCTTINFIFMNRGTSMSYVTLSGGEKIEDVVNSAFTNSANATSSTIKNYVDNWYVYNLASYSDYIEDTVYCNDRSIAILGGWSKDGSVIDSATTKLNFGFNGRLVNPTVKTPTFDCPNPSDRFTVSDTKGNGALTYPIALLTADEAAFAGYVWGSTSNNNYLDNGGKIWWTMTPTLSSVSFIYMAVIYSIIDNVHTTYVSNDAGGVRPVISLAYGTQVKGGIGTVNNPYVLVKDGETINFDLNAGLPEGYTLLDYIEGYGAQYIDTGYSNSSGFYGDATISFTALNGAESLLGSHNLSSPYGRNYVGIDDDGTKWNIGTGNVYLASTQTISIGDIYNIDYSTLLTGSYLNVNGTQVIVSTDSNSRSTENVLIFACQWSLTHNELLAQMKLYNLKIYNSNNELVRDFVPCMNSNGTVGLYDKVGGNFYTNLGTGAFTGERILSDEEMTKDVVYGEAYGELPTPEREGYNFLGWYDAATSGNKIESSTIAVKGANIKTLYAQWSKID